MYEKDKKIHILKYTIYILHTYIKKENKFLFAKTFSKKKNEKNEKEKYIFQLYISKYIQEKKTKISCVRMSKNFRFYSNFLTTKSR